MPKQYVSRCPCCGGTLEVIQLLCPACETTISGRFPRCSFCHLSSDDLEFVRAFLKCRGSIKDVEQELGISYPTVRNRLDQVLRGLGLASTEGEDPRSEILLALERGEISAQEATERLRNA